MDKYDQSSFSSIERPFTSSVALQRYQRNDTPAAPYIVEPYDNGESGTALVEYWRILMRHKLILLCSALGGIAVGLLLTAMAQPIYRAQTAVEVLSVNQDFMNMRQAQASVPQADSSDLSEEETQAALLQSDPLLTDVALKVAPDGLPTFKLATSGWRSWFHMKEHHQQTADEKLVMRALKTLKVTNAPRTRVLSLSVDSTDPEFAKKFLDTLMQEFVARNIKARWASTQQTSDWLNQELGDARSRLQQSELALQNYAQRSHLFFTDQESETNVATEKLQQIQSELATATADRIAKQSNYELVKNTPPDALPDVVGDQAIQALRARIDDAARNVASLTALYNSGYPKVKQAQAELDTLRQAYAQKRSDLLAKIQTDYDSSVRREKLLSREYDQQAREVAGQDERTVQYNVLKREVDSNRQLYDTMLQQMKQASVAVALRASNVRVVSPAYLMPKPVSPNAVLNAILGLFAGFLASIAFIFAREKADRTLRRPGDLRLCAALPELGSIPRYSLANPRKALLRIGSGSSDSAAALQDFPVPVNEAFQAALTSILMTADSRSGSKVLVFTSAEAGDGKTSVVSNVGIAAAKIGKRVLVVDADLRRPRIHEVFGIKREPGLSNLLTGSGLQTSNVVQSTTVPGLSVVSAGPSSSTAVHAFYSSHFAGLLREWREQYDLVLLDTPPALQISDARIIGSQSDGVILVARAEQTSREALVALRDRFMEDSTRLLGCILNDWDPRQSTHMYSYYMSTGAEA